jgi:hypothetical protein
MVHFCLFVLWIFNGYDVNPSDTSTSVSVSSLSSFPNVQPRGHRVFEYSRSYITPRLVQVWGARLICGTPEVPAGRELLVQFLPRSTIHVSPYFSRLTGGSA